MANKAEFIEMLAERLDGDRKRAAAALDAVVQSIYASVAKGEKVAISGFGVFERRDKAARIGRNPLTGASVQVPARKTPHFRPGTEFKDKTNASSGAPARKAAKKAAKKTAAKKAATKKTAAKKAAPAKKAAAKKVATKKVAAKKAQKAAAKKAAAKKTTARKTAAKRA